MQHNALILNWIINMCNKSDLSRSRIGLFRNELRKSIEDVNGGARHTKKRCYLIMERIPFMKFKPKCQIREHCGSSTYKRELRELLRETDTMFEKSVEV